MPTRWRNWSRSGVAPILLGFQPVRQLGTAMIASAGVAGTVIGLAPPRRTAVAG